MQVDKQKFINWVNGYTNYEDISIRATEIFTGWSSKDMEAVFSKSKDIVSLLEEVVNLVERFSKDIDALSSREKLEMAVEFIDDIVKFPFYIEWADGIIIKYVLTTIVEYKNKWFGKDWFIE